jgi:hypothetical protein
MWRRRGCSVWLGRCGGPRGAQCRKARPFPRGAQKTIQWLFEDSVACCHELNVEGH